jgi:hypothetical protein
VIVISAVAGLVVLVAGAIVIKTKVVKTKKVVPSLGRGASIKRKIVTHNGRLSIVIPAVSTSDDAKNAGDILEYTLDGRFKMICSTEDLYQKHRRDLRKIKIWQVSQLFAWL